MANGEWGTSGNTAFETGIYSKNLYRQKLTKCFDIKSLADAKKYTKDYKAANEVVSLENVK